MYKKLGIMVGAITVVTIICIFLFMRTPNQDNGYTAQEPEENAATAPLIASAQIDNIGLTIRTYGNFETAGINLRFDDKLYEIYNHEFVFRRNVTAGIHYRKYSTTNWFEGHFFSIYDKRGMATSLFNLELDTLYELRVLVWEDDELIFDNIRDLATVHTRPEFEVPDFSGGEADGWFIVRPTTHEEIQRAVDNAGPGTVILLEGGSDFNRNGTGIAFNMQSRAGTYDRPIIITSDGERATVRGTAIISNSNHVMVHNLRLTNMDTPRQWSSNYLLRISGTSTHVTISDNYIHDQGFGSHLGAIHVTGAVGVHQVHHLFIDNNIANDHHEYAQGAWNISVFNRGYYGIYFRDEPNLGGMYTVRNNTFVGFVDAIHSSGYYGRPPLLWSTAGLIDHEDFLSVWYIQEIDIYDNIIYESNDDALQTDGHAVNARFFRNIVGSTHTGISNAHLYPGPSFYIENVFTSINDGALKTNTGIGAVGPEPGHGEATMNMFVYNNTFIHNLNYPSAATLWQDFPGRVASATVMNNIFVARDRNRELGGSANTTYNYLNIDGNLYYSLTGSQFIRIWDEFEVWEPGILTWTSFEDYQRENPFGFEQNSIFALSREELGIDLGVPHPDFPTTPWITYPESVHMHDVSLQPTSLAINNGVFIPGVSRSATPNIGASHAYNTGTARPTAMDPLALRVVYDANGGFGDVPVDITGHQLGSTVAVITDAPTLTKPGFTFAGWSFDSAETNWDSGLVSFEVETAPARVVLYAIWKPIMMLDAVTLGNITTEDTGIPATNPQDASPGRIILPPNTNVLWESVSWNITGTAQVTNGAIFPPGDVPQDVSGGAWVDTLRTGSVIVFTLQDDTGTTLYQVLIVEVEGETLGDRVLIYHDADGTPVRRNYYHSGETAAIDFFAAPQREHFEFIGWSTNETTAQPMFSPGGTESLVARYETIELFPVWRPSSVYISWLTINGVYADLGVPHADPRLAVPGMVRITQAQAQDLRFFVHEDAPEGEEGDFDPERNVAEIQYGLAGHDGVFKVVPFAAGDDIPSNAGIDAPVQWVGSRAHRHTFNTGDFMGIRVNWEGDPASVRLYYIIFIEITN